jgi:hypothetical protein
LASEVVVRPYADGDYDACRSLWAELTEYHRGIYGDPSIGGDDPGAGLDGYLAEPLRAGSWVAEFTAFGGHIDLTMDLAPRRLEWLPGASLHGLEFDY